MKISIDIDAKPQELREFFGLPDIEPLQQELLEQIREKMLGGAAGFDPATLLKPYFSEQLRSAAHWQQAMWEVLRKGSGQGAASEPVADKQEPDRQP